MYMVVDATRFSTICCFDYGNAETSGADDGNATMEALYWGASTQWTRGGGNGPWFAADLENGMFEEDSTNVPSNTSVTGWTYATGMLKGPSGNAFGLKAGNAQSGALQTEWNGKRPAGYSPMKKQGAHHPRHGRRRKQLRPRNVLRGCDHQRQPVRCHP